MDENPEISIFRPVRIVVEWFARSPWRAFVIIFLLSFAIRGYILSLLPTEIIRPNTQRENPAIAILLAQKGEFSNPYMLPTGPTAHLPPLAPLPFALFYKLFGLTLTAGYIAWLFIAAMYSILNGMLPWLAGKFGLGRQAGVLAGYLIAFIPQWAGHGEGLTAVMLGLLMVAFLRRWTTLQVSMKNSLLIGIGWGIAFHVQPALLTVLLGYVVFELWWLKQRRWIMTLAIASGVLLACIPWGWRNYSVFHDVFFIRSNFGLELRMGNHEGAAAAMDVMDMKEEFRHPRTHWAEARLMQKVGEMEYMHRARKEALQWIKTNPAEFGWLTVQRFLYVWFGPWYEPAIGIVVTLLTLLAVLGAWKIMPKLAVPQRAALVIPILTFPLVYYFVAYMPRYREPIDWILFLLAGALVWRWIKQSQQPPTGTRWSKTKFK
jgi:hypothetical protein